MNKAVALCAQYRKWLIVLAVLAGMALTVAAVRAATPEPRTIAEPSTEHAVTFDLEKNRVYSAEDGIIVVPASNPAGGLGGTRGDLVPPARFAVSDSEPATSAEVARTLGSAYTLSEDAQLPDGSIGTLSIPKLGLTVGVFESNDEMEAMTHGLAHFKTTSAWAGNIGLCGHNINFDLTDGHFKRLYTLSEGDVISYKTALGNRSYTVTAVKEIAADDWSWLGRTEDNRITMITCISGKPDVRLMVQAVSAE
jgi:LPXTG-site transpeptidase (sortase) family protein